MILLQRGKTILMTYVSFFNELATEKKTMLVTSISFFNELSIEKKTMLVDLLDHSFQEDNSLEGMHVKGQMSIMASKRSSLDGRESLWKECMSTTSIRVGRSISNSPIEEITMSTTRSRSQKVELTVRGSSSSVVEGMGDNAT
jgi:hypothetical protein